MNSTKRLNRSVADFGFCSRREAEKLIFAGKIFVNGQIETNPARQIDAQTDIITFGFDIGEFRENKIYVKLNKPVGYVVSAQEKEGPTVFELVADCPQKVFPIGRLDKDSSGLLLFTSDTTLTARLIGEDSDCEKEYYVKTVSPIDDDDLERMRRGMTILGEMTKPAVVVRQSGSSFLITLREGKNRQIRRMCESVGNRVKSLKRIRFGDILLGDLPLGQWRLLDAEEKKSLENF